MIESTFFQILVIFGFTALVSYLSALLRFPIIISFILSGLLIGPNGLGLVSHGAMIESMAEIGLAMLLFSIGLEFDQEKIRNVRRFFFLGGFIQVASGLVVFFLSFLVFGIGAGRALFMAMMCCMSSSAMVFRLLKEKQVTRSVQGNLISGILLFQDIAFVPMLISIPFLFKGSGEAQDFSFPLNRFFFYGGLLLLMILLMKYFSERFFRYLVKLDYRELNLMLALLIPFAFSVISHKLGFSFALGAFIAGMLLSESDFHLRIVSDIMPFRDIFNAFFFIAAGMLFEFSSFLSEWPVIMALLLLLVLIKFIIVFAVARMFRFSRRHAAYCALFLFQASEFTFVLADTGLQYRLIGQNHFNVFFSVTILSLLLTPLAVAAAEKFFRINNEEKTAQTPQQALTKHTVVAGYGLIGRNLALVLKKVNIPFLVVDLNYENVKRMRQEKVHFVFGDISSEEVLDRVNIGAAAVTPFFHDAYSSSQMA